jgi:ribonuclease R
MDCDEHGNVHDYSVSETVIKSCKRFTYAEAQSIIDTGQGPYHELVLELYKLSLTLRDIRYKKGGVDFVTQETKFSLDEDKFPIAAVLKTRTDATSLVEECMLLANQTIALHVKHISKKHLKKGVLPFIYRVHDEPDMMKLKDVLRFVKALGVHVPNGVPSSRELNTILEHVAHLPEKMVINQFLLRSMAKAIYVEENIGHYGLGFSDYTHFTSPIRRYPDVLVHRLLKEYALRRFSISSRCSKRLCFIAVFIEISFDIGSRSFCMSIISSYDFFLSKPLTVISVSSVLRLFPILDTSASLSPILRLSSLGERLELV